MLFRSFALLAFMICRHRSYLFKELSVQWVGEHGDVVGLSEVRPGRSLAVDLVKDVTHSRLETHTLTVLGEDSP